MQVQQAIFTSARTNRMCGYHVVARSAGIGEEIAGRLFAWGPTHASLADPDWGASSLNFFPLIDPWFAVGRTVYGGPEYSNRGGRQIVTVSLVLSRQQLAGYDNNPLILARTARALGHLRLLAAVPERLPTVDLPDCSASCPEPTRCPERVPDPLVESILERLRSGRRAAAIGVPEPLPVLEKVFLWTSLPDRLALSFTTGLKPSQHRPFRLHFLPDDEAIRRQLATLGLDSDLTPPKDLRHLAGVPSRSCPTSALVAHFSPPG